MNTVHTKITGLFGEKFPKWRPHPLWEVTCSKQKRHFMEALRLFLGDFRVI